MHPFLAFDDGRFCCRWKQTAEQKRMSDWAPKQEEQ
jgi:hypothetical protein